MTSFRSLRPRQIFRHIMKIYFIFSTFLFLAYLILDKDRTSVEVYKSKPKKNSLDYDVYINGDKTITTRNETKKRIDAKSSRLHDYLSGDLLEPGSDSMITLELEDDIFGDHFEDDEDMANMFGEEKDGSGANKSRPGSKGFNQKWKRLIKEQNELYNHSVVKNVKDVQMAYLTAIATNSSGGNGSAWDIIMINGWERMKFDHFKLYCCFVRGNNSAMTTVKKRPTWKTPKIRVVVAIQFICDNPWSDNMTSLPLKVGVSTSATCKDIQYVDVEYAIKPEHDESMAICGKIIYGTYPAERIVEWLEMNKAMGVGHFALFTYNVTKQAMAVLKYYQAAGYVTLKEFDFPLKSIFPRFIGQKYLLAWVDEQVTVFDCVQRFGGYKYLGILDVDEFLVPKNPDVKNYPSLMKRLVRKYPKAAGFTFQTEMFVLSWGETHRDSSLLIGRYRNRTKPLWDRRKSVFMMDRVLPQSVWTHGFNPTPPYNRIHLKANVASVFHYRNCRPRWYTNGTCLIKAQRYPDNTMLRYTTVIEETVRQISKRLVG